MLLKSQVGKNREGGMSFFSLQIILILKSIRQVGELVLVEELELYEKIMIRESSIIIKIKKSE